MKKLWILFIILTSLVCCKKQNVESTEKISTSQQKENFDQQEENSEKFDDFIIQFCTDSSFQISRIKFPLLYITWDYDIDKEMATHITKENYKFDRLFCYSDAYSVFYDNFDCKFRDTGEMVFRWRGFTDMDSRYYFKRIKGKWILIKILDYDPIK